MYQFFYLFIQTFYPVIDDDEIAVLLHLLLRPLFMDPLQSLRLGDAIALHDPLHLVAKGAETHTMKSKSIRL